MVLTRSSNLRIVSIALVILGLLMPAVALDVDPQLDVGYRLLYNLDFSHAQRVVSSWEQQHSDDPLGPASEAAGILSSEVHRLGVLDAQFHENDSGFEAHLAGGISRYLIGSMAAPMRWILRLGGVKGDKQAGIAELQLTAERGHYLAPFARILLAIAYVRDKDPARARELLVSLRRDFPENPLFAREIARLDSGR